MTPQPPFYMAWRPGFFAANAEFNSDDRISPLGALSGSNWPCLATVMKIHILFLHYVVLNEPKYPLLEGNVDRCIRSIDNFFVEKP